MRAFSILAVCTMGICLMLVASFSTLTASSSPIEATVNIDPDTLNLKDGGEWITVYIELPDPANLSDIDISTVLVDGVVPTMTDPKYGFVTNPEVGDIDDDGIPELMVKFDRQGLIDYVLTYKLGHMGIVLPLPREGVEVELTITGTLNDGTTTFEGTDEIRVILHEPSAS